MPIPVDVEELADDRCAFNPGSDNPAMLALYLGMLDADFEVDGSPDLSAALRSLASRFTRAAGTLGWVSRRSPAVPSRIAATDDN